MATLIRGALGTREETAGTILVTQYDKIQNVVMKYPVGHCRGDYLSGKIGDCLTWIFRILKLSSMVSIVFFKNYQILFTFSVDEN